MVGLSLLIFPTIAHLRPGFRVGERREFWLGPLAGAVAGLLGGVSGLPGPPLMIYLACLRLPKQEFVVAVSLMFLVAALGLGLGLATFADTSLSELALSSGACIPVFAGMWLGSKIRVQIDEIAFRRLVLATYLATGASFLLKAAW